jgi:DnaK suppressor protein
MAAFEAPGGDPSWAGMEERLTRDRARAVEQIESLSRLVGEIIAGATDVATDDEHDPEGQTIAFERAQATAQMEAERARLANIDAALARLRDGSYGICERCGEPIAPERLEAMPAVRTCIACASRRS